MLACPLFERGHPSLGPLLLQTLCMPPHSSSAYFSPGVMPYGTTPLAPPRVHAVINVGGDEGWVAKEYDPITVYVGDTLNFTAGTTEEGRFVVAGMGNQDNFDECNFTGKGVRNLGFEALLTYKKAGTRYYSSPGLGGSLCREGLMKLEVDVLPGECQGPRTQEKDQGTASTCVHDDEGKRKRVVRGQAGEGPLGVGAKEAHATREEEMWRIRLCVPQSACRGGK